GKSDSLFLLVSRSNWRWCKQILIIGQDLVAHKVCSFIKAPNHTPTSIRRTFGICNKYFTKFSASIIGVYELLENIEIGGKKPSPSDNFECR
ncbi:MAG: hypothetical protein MHMPM18_004228, partial [Marteilia pararefringens]